VRCGLDSTGSGWGLTADFCQQDNEPSCFIRAGNPLTSWETINFCERRYTMESGSCNTDLKSDLLTCQL